MSKKNMDKATWKEFIDHYWGTLAFWQMVQLYREHNPPGAFFNLAGMAIRDHFLMRLSHTFHLCNTIQDEYIVGPKAEKIYAKIIALADRGYTKNAKQRKKRNDSMANDCGINLFRNEVLAHPVGKEQILLGKTPSELSLKWETVKETLSKINQFCAEIEHHYLKTWNYQAYKEEVEGITDAFMSALYAIKDGEKYDLLRRKIMPRGQATVEWDRETDDLVLHEAK
jgi:hypothetical protein